MKEQTNTIERAVNTLRVISAETINAANSGHSGIALGAAPIMYSLYASMKIDTAHPNFFNRDQFVLSVGHGSALLYTTLHFAGFDISKEDLKAFRRLGSKLPGHPELGTTPGVDCTTGPLGQGVAIAVGLALAEKKLSATYNKPGFDVVDHYTFCLAGDGCLMEGISYEACNLAGLWKLNKLILLYDSNEVTLDGARKTADGEDIISRFKAINWDVIEVNNGEDVECIMAAIAQAKKSESAPTIIVIKTTIGYGAKTAGTSKAHGAVLSTEEIALMRAEWGLTEIPFGADSDVKKHFAALSFKNLNRQKQWQEKLVQYRVQYSKLYKELEQFFNPQVLANIRQNGGFTIQSESKEMALRDAGGIMLKQAAAQSPRVFGGSADISSTTKAFVSNSIWSHNNPTGTDIAFGVREFAMAAICNGLALHGFTPYCSTFLAFSDYARPAIRLTALMNLPVTYIFSHDGFGNSQDGPTHQAGEHISSLRLIPNLNVYRPADDSETAAVYKQVFEDGKPACIILGRGQVPPLKSSYKNIARGGYIVSDGMGGKSSVILLSTGSEVSLCMQAQELLRKAKIEARVVSMPSCEIFDHQPPEYIASVLGGGLPIIAIELGSSDLWYKYIGSNGMVIGFDTFGESAANDALLKQFGFTPDNIAKEVLRLLKK